MDEETALFDLEVQLLLEAVYRRYQHDFRDYAVTSVRRRMHQAMKHFGCEDLGQLQHLLLHDGTRFRQALQFFTVQVSEMFRDPAYFCALREQVVPVLRTYPSLKVWVAGCSQGEEAWSLAVLLQEEALLDRTLIYATDINPAALETAEGGIYPIERMADFSRNYRAAGGLRSLSDYYTAAYGGARFDPALGRHMVFADHSLATDSVFSEVQFISCRNVLIYFDRPLQNRALDLFNQSLCRRGWLGLGIKETLRFTSQAEEFDEIRHDVKLYRRRR